MLHLSTPDKQRPALQAAYNRCRKFEIRFTDLRRGTPVLACEPGSQPYEPVRVWFCTSV